MIREIFEQGLPHWIPGEEARTTALVEEYRRELRKSSIPCCATSRPEGSRPIGRITVISQLAETAVETLASTIAMQKPVPSTSFLIGLTKGIVFRRNRHHHSFEKGFDRHSHGAATAGDTRA